VKLRAFHQATANAHGLIKRSNREARAFTNYAKDPVEAGKPDHQVPDTQEQASVRFVSNDGRAIEDPVSSNLNASPGSAQPL